MGATLSARGDAYEANAVRYWSALGGAVGGAARRAAGHGDGARTGDGRNDAATACGSEREPWHAPRAVPGGRSLRHDGCTGGHGLAAGAADRLRTGGAGGHDPRA